MAKKSQTDAASRVAFDSIEEAQKSQPSDLKRFRLFQVSDPSGRVFFTWSDGCWSATVNVVRAVGWRANILGQAPSTGEIRAKFQMLSPEDRAILIAEWAKSNGLPATQEPEKAPAPVQAPAKKAGK